MASLVAVLGERCTRHGSREAFLFLDDAGEPSESIDYAGLDRRARAVATALVRRGAVAGDPVLLLYPPGLDLIASFWGCLYAGAVAVPAYPPRPGGADARLAAVAGDCRPRLVATTSRLEGRVGSLLAGVEHIATDTLTDEGELAASWRPPGVGRDHVAFLQYTSGSTSAPKGVMVRHGNLLHNQEAIRRAFGTTEASVVAGWLPLYHDMGLIGTVLHPLYLGARCVLTSPLAFLRRPRLWLEMIDRHRATVSGGPNFAYDLCVRRVPESERAGLDLSSWRVAFNGAEPVRARTLEEFAAAFAPCGFDRRAFFPCYGLAESTLFVTGADLEAPPTIAAFDPAALEAGRAEPAPEGRELVSSGRPVDARVEIVDPGTGARRAPGRIGEIWVASESVAAGYRGGGEAGAETFGATLEGDGQFLRTGDLGFLRDGELFVTGRLKDLIILRGRNLYPQDVEATAEASHPALRPAGAAAFAVDVAGEERLVVAAELERRREGEAPEAVAALRRAVADQHQAAVHEVVLLRAGTLPRTTSGKLRRAACRAFYRGEERRDDRLFLVVARDRLPAAAAEPATAVADRETLLALDPTARAAALEGAVAALAAEVLAVAAEAVDPEAPLTAAGLDSLGAIELADRLEARLDLRVSLARLLAGASAADLARSAEGAPGAPAGGELVPLRAGGTEDVLPLSWEQRSLWFLEGLAAGSGVTHVAVAAETAPGLDAEALRRALAEVVARHPALRTVIETTGDGPRQRVLPAASEPPLDFALETVEASAGAGGAPARLSEEAFRPFDLERGPLVRVRLWPRSGGGHLLLLAAHHLAVDLASFEIVLRDLEAAYRRATGDDAAPPPPPPQATYGDYARRQEALLRSPAGARLEAAWRQLLAGRTEPLELPADRPRPALQTYRGGRARLTFEPPLAERLRALAGGSGATLFQVLMAALHALLRRLSGQWGVAVATPVSGRGAGRFRDVVGDFANLVLVAPDAGPDPCFLDLLAATARAATAAVEHRAYPFALLAETLAPARDPSRPPLAQAMFRWQQARSSRERAFALFGLGVEGAEVELAGRPLAAVAIANRPVQLDLELSAAEGPDGGVVALLDFNRDLFDATTAARWLALLRTLLAAAVEHPERRVSELDLLPPAERARLREWNDTGDRTPAAPVEARIARHLSRSPDRIAVGQGARALTRDGLHRRALRFAAELRRRGAGPEVRVAVCLERDPDLVTVVVAILYAGAAWVPLDPDHPPARLADVLAGSGASLLVGPRGLLDRRFGVEAGPAAGVRRLAVEDLAAAPPAEGLPLGAPPRHLAYTIYTSGSTGRPKGVEVPRGALAAFLDAVEEELAPGEDDLLAAVTTLGFDISILELLLPLATGGRVEVVPRDEAADGARLGPLLDRARATLLQATPATWRLLLDAGWQGREGLTALCGGEALSRELAAALAARTAAVVNLYGPTECTVWATARRVDGGAAVPPAPVVPLGRPLPGTRAHVVDRHLRPVPSGVAGELHLGGAGVARGYRARPGQTAELFVPDPASPAPGGRLYRTGDLARHLASGEIEFLGRADHQVKIRGFRIEMGEIEAVLGAHPGVHQAVVVAEGPREGARLVAWVVPEATSPEPDAGRPEEPEEPAAGWRRYLEERLPAYMVPSLFLPRDRLPLGPSGKVDRRALAAEAAAEGGRRRSERPWIEPAGALETTIAGVFGEVLGVDRVGAADDFFALGGHSLGAARCVARLRAALGVDLPLSALFVRPTPAALAAWLEREGGARGAQPEASVAAWAPPGEPAPLSFAQERLWFLERLSPGSAAYHLPGRGRLRGPLSPAALTTAVADLVRRHEALATRIVETAGGGGPEIARQAVLPSGPAGAPLLPRIDLAGIPAPLRRRESRLLAFDQARRPFQLAGGRLVRFALVARAPEDHELHLCLHHLVADGRSLEVLLHDLADLYTAALEGRHPTPPASGPTPRDFAAWQRHRLADGAFEPQLAWWREYLDGVPGTLDLPADRPRPPVRSFAGARATLALPEETAAAAGRLAEGRGATLFMVLLAAFQVLLHRLSDAEDFVVGTPAANRRRGELDRMVGLLANLLAVRARLAGEPRFDQVLAAARRAVLDTHERQEAPFEKLVEELRPERDPARPPLVQVAFAAHSGWPRRPFGAAELGLEELPTGSSKFDLTLTIEGTARGLVAHLEHSTELFDPATARRWLGAYGELLRDAAARPGARLSDLSLLSAAERRQLLAEGIGAAAAPYGGGVHRLVAEAARRWPEAPAVVAGERRLSYRELAGRSGALAGRLHALGVGPEAVVALDLERSPELAVAALGVLSAGGAYLPLDPGLPAERLAWILADSGARALVRSGAARRPPAGVAVIDLEGLDLESAADLGSGPFDPPPADPRQTAYVIYTSGSSGEPKGVAVPHGGLENLVRWHLAAYGPAPGERSSLVASPGFDASVWELWPCLASGGALHVPDAETRADPDRLAAWLAATGVHVAFLPTPLARAVLASLPPGGAAGGELRALLTGGDRLPAAPAVPPPFRLVNHYGPTESSVVTTAGEVAPGGAGAPPIGRPIAGLAAHLADRRLRLAAPHTPGELVIGGAGLARGYRRRPAATAAAFVPDPFGSEPGGRLYRSGDLARRRGDGALDFLGRIDQQVQVRGHRVETGEVEAALGRLPGVAEAAVVARTGAGGETALAAFVVPAPGAQPADDEILAGLVRWLPAYMVPASVGILDELPLTARGKVDRAALRARPVAAVPARPAGRGGMPRTPVEELVVALVAELLERERVAVDDDFFALGGHSLLAGRLAARIRETFGVELELAAVFEGPTPAALARRVEAALHGAREPEAGPVPATALARPDRPPLSFAQERLWFLDRLASVGAAYHVAGGVRLRGELDADRLETSLAAVVARHEVLRTRFPAADGVAWQEVGPVPERVLTRVDLRGVVDPDGALERLAHRRARHPFDLESGPLHRFTLVRLDEGEHVLLVALHHAVADGGSLPILWRDLAALYGGEELPPLALQYADYALWQRRRLDRERDRERLAPELAWWREHLAGLPPVLELSADRPRPPRASGTGGVVRRTLPAELVASADGLARRSGASRFMVLLAVFQALLGRSGGQEDFAVGTPMADRGRGELEDLVGLFLDTLVLRADLAGDPPFRELLRRVRATALGAYAHRNLPFERLVEALAPARSRSHEPLVQVLLVLEAGERVPDRLGDLAARAYDTPTGAARLDLTLSLAPRSDGGLDAHLEYAADLFDATTAARLAARFAHLLGAAARSPDARLSDLPAMPAGERFQVLHEWNDTRRRLARSASGATSLGELFARQAERTPESVAVVEDGSGAPRHLTFGALARRGGALAAHLASLGVGPEVAVGLCAERSLELVVGLLAVVEAGGAWLPLDPSYPRERLEWMLEDAGAPVVVAEGQRRDLLAAYAGEIVPLEPWSRSSPPAPPGSPPRRDPPPEAAAYLIYTSGSTGRPKGVVNGHRGIVNRLLWFQQVEPLGPDDRVLQKTPIGFDVSVWELFWPLVTGARLVLARPGGHRDGAYLAAAVARHRVTTAHFVPSMLAPFLEEPGLESDCRTLRRVVASGEALAPELVARYARRLGAPLYDLYGPTEAAVEVSWARVAAGGEPERPDVVPIGRPISNLRLVVADPALRPAPLGVPGELVIGGAGVARGYLRRPGATAERFVPDPHASEPGARAYRTGDRARTLARGEIDFLGRLDQQVKVRGQRIEPGEIEAVLAARSDVRGAAVVAVPDGAGGLRLAAFVVPAGTGSDPAALREALARELPPAMVPSAVLPVPELPLTPSGKLDRAALAALAREAPAAAAAGVARRAAPRGPVEDLLAGIWSELLGVPDPAVDDDFFALGGHSLLATRVMSRVRRALDVELPLEALFEAPTVAGLARAVERAASAGGGEPRPPLERAPARAAEPEPSFAQERLWFLDRLEPGTANYNLPTALRLRGPLDGAALARALTRIAARHETLRTSFVERDGRPRLRIARPGPVVPPWVDLSGLARRPNLAERELGRVLRRAAERPFDLDRGPLWRTLLLRLGPRKHVLAATLHHAVADGWSLGLLVRELTAGLGGDAPPPSELPVSYSDYARWQRSWLRGEVLESRLAWWRGVLDGLPALAIPGDRPRGPIARATGATWPVALPAALVRDLEDLARAHGGTLFMALLAGFAVVLGRHAGREVLPVGTAAAHRDDPAVEDLIGLFVNTLALRVDLGGEPTVGELLERVRATTLGAFRHQDLPFERLVEELRPERDLRVAPLVPVMLVLQNAPLPPLELPGLTLEPLEVESPSAKLDLTLSLGRRPDGGLAGTLRYRSDLLDATSAGRMARHLETVLRGMAGAGQARAARRLSDLPLQPPAERHQVLLEWSVDAAAGFRRGAPPTLPELFARWVERTPDAPAVVAEGPTGDLVLTYGELGGRAAALAARLAARGVGAGDRVGLIADPSLFTVAAILACFERGAAYVPVDPATPPARRAEILEDAGVAAVLGPGEPERAPVSSRLRPPARPAPTAGLAYVIYTSGSTGRPKGVAVEHRHLAAYLDGLAARLEDGPAPASWATVSRPATDLGNTAIFGALGSGACLHLPARERAGDAEALGAWLERHPVEALKIVPSHLAALLSGERPERLLPRRWLVVGGEACGSALVEAVRALRPGCRVLVHYGPTETTVGVAGWPVPPRVPPAATLPLGRPFRGTRVVVADAAGRPVPPGAPGELLLAGAQVARGYLGRPAATAAAFLPDPYPAAAAGARLYRSGDLSRQRADGLLEFLGRIDHQVKVRGHRVETGEVEAALLAVPGVAEAAVIPWGEGTATRLVAYVAPARGSEVPEGEALRRSLLARLPEAMVPAAFVVLDLLPRLANGKVDRAGLRRAAAGDHPDLPAPNLREGGEAPDAAGAGRPLTPTEEIVAHFWSELLGVARPDPGADFFALGGHSLLATRLASRLRRTFGVDLPLRALFEAPTLAGLAAQLEEARGGAADPEPPLPPAPEPASDGGDAPLSFAQERLWLLDRLAPGDAAYAVPYALAVRGRLDAAALAAALGTLVRRHPGLRTTFPLVDGAPVQRVHPPAAVTLPTIDLAALPADRRAAVAAREVEGVVRRPFDLARGPLMRALLVRLGEDRHRVVVTLHHVVSDAWSRGILARELGRLYSARVAGRPAPELPAPAVSYADYARWQRRHLAGERLDALLASWRRALDGLPPLELPTDRPRREAARRPAARVTATLPAPLAAALGELARREGATLFMVLLAAFDLVLARHAGQDDLAVGTSVANRERPEVEGVIGFFVNTLVLRARLGELAPGAGFRDLLAQARGTTLDAYAHQALPFERLVEELRPAGRRGAAPLVQAMLVLQNAPGGLPELAGAEVAPLAVDTGSAKFELTMVAEPRNDGALGLTIELDRGLYDATTGARLAGHLRNLLAAAVAAPEAPLPALDMLSPAERHQALAEWSGSGVTPPELDLPIPRIFARRAAEVPDAVAVSSQGGELTYAELSRRAARLARRLRALSVGAETRVGLCAERSPEMVVATLAVLQAGAAYVPLDPRYPRERLAFMAANAAVSVVLADADRLGLFEGLEGVRTRLLSSGGAEGGSDGPRIHDHDDSDAPPLPAWTPDRLAYVMYTSGSTGLPKGVAVPHRAIVRLVRPGASPAYARFAADETFLQYAPISFDAATLEIWAPLLNGGRLVLAPPGRLSLSELGRAVERGRVTSAWLTAGLFHRAVEDALGSLGGLTRLLAGGDVLSPPHVRRALAALPGLTVVNGYGPTENTTFTCCHVLRGADDVGATVPVGRPIAGTRTYLVDPALRPAPPGAAGELVAAGAGLARGYLGRPARTAALFVPDPFAERPGGRLYRTGDLARHRRDGAVEFLGRRDRQVKVRGFRVEPGEIEALLVARPEVREAVVVPRETPAGRALVAYLVPALVPAPGPRAGDDELRRALAERLPEHALPAAFVRLDALPLDPNGKVDRTALPEPGRDAEALDAEAPEGPVEELLSVLWTETLGRPAGRNEDFFDAGGNSLQATRLVARIRQAFGVELPLERVFDRPTVAGLAGEVAEALSAAGPAGATSAAPPLERRPGSGPAPLSFAQERLWFLEQLEPGDPAYHVPAAIRLGGTLDVRALSGALAAVVARQAALRTRFVVRAGTPFQEVDPPRPGRALLPLADLEALPAPRRAAATAALLRAAARRGFDLSAAPPVRFLLVRDTERAHVLSIVMHHAVADGWSLGVLLRELTALYAVLAAGASTRDAGLPELPVEYPDFAAWQRRWLAGAELERQLDFWRRHLAEAPSLHLPYDRPAGAAAGRRGERRELRLGRELTEAIESACRRASVTPYMLLLAAFDLLLARYAGQDDLVVGTPVANRTRVETEGLVGCFVNTLALRARLDPDEGFDLFLARVRADVLAAHAHQDLPFEKLVEELPVARDLAATPLFQTLFVLQNLPWPRLELPGLAAAAEGVGTGAAKFDLTLALAGGLTGSQDGLHGTLEYAADRFDATTAGRLARAYRTLLEAVAADPSRRLRELPLLAAAERAQVLVQWSEDGAAATASATTLPALLEARVAEAPEAVALVAGGERLSYRELDGRANRLAHLLRARGAGPETPVGVLLERNADLVVALLAVLKAGGAYVPLDPAYPPARLELLLADSGAPLVLTSSALAPLLGSLAGGGRRETVALDELAPELAALPGNPPAPQPAPGQLAYVIYTSGSTGRPKGVALEHAAAAALASWADGAYSAGELSGVLASTSVSFDLSVFEILTTLALGGRVILADHALALAELPARHEVTLLNTVPSAMAELLRLGAVPASVRTVNLAGEPLRRALVDEIGRRTAASRVLNLYGPSEDTTYSTWAPAERGAREEPGIGRPLPGTRVRLLGPGLEPVPLGAVGEIHLGGAGLARGYRRRPGLTADRFTPDPWSAAPGRRLYRTGDLARFTADGRLVFLGRADHQVKVRGFRIELGEVEAALTALPGVEDAAVAVVRVAGEEGTDRLAAWVVPAADGAPGSDRLRELLRARLPPHMVPGAFRFLPALPRTPNGKLDRRALPTADAAPEERPFQPPRDALEEVLASLWAEALRVDRVGVDDDFFDLGGHSLLATRLAFRLRETLRLEIPLRELFAAPTVAGLAAALRREPACRAHVDRVAELVLRVARMSEQEADRMMATEPARSA
jgi:amino acid adenylation domain-containing protein